MTDLLKTETCWSLQAASLTFDLLKASHEVGDFRIKSNLNQIISAHHQYSSVNRRTHLLWVLVLTNLPDLGVQVHLGAPDSPKDSQTDSVFLLLA